MIIADVETGHIRLEAWGDNAFIIRKGKKIKIPSGEVESKLIQEFQKTRDSSKLDKFKEEHPKLMDGDTVVCGKQTDIRIDVGYNKGKEKPADDWKQNASKTVSLFPDSELQLSGFEKWDKVVKVNEYEKRFHGAFIKNIELKKGFFSVSYTNNPEDVLVTPVALIKFVTGSSGFFDVYEDSLYSNCKAEYTNRLTKKSFVAKSDMPEEIIVTKNAIYRRGMLQMDDVFANSLQLQLHLQNKANRMLSLIDEKTMSAQMANMGGAANALEQGLGGMEMLKQMSPGDLERLMKQGEAHGAKVTPEMMKQMKELPAMMKAFEKEGYMEQMKKATAMAKGMNEGMGSKGMERLAKLQVEGLEKLKKHTEQPIQAVTSEGKSVNIDSFFDSPRKYKPLTDAKKVA